jgi:hypothetical protein
MLLPEPGAPLDVGEQKGDGAGGHGATGPGNLNSRSFHVKTLLATPDGVRDRQSRTPTSYLPA